MEAHLTEEAQAELVESRWAEDVVLGETELFALRTLVSFAELWQRRCIRVGLKTVGIGEASGEGFFIADAMIQLDVEFPGTVPDRLIREVVKLGRNCGAPFPDDSPNVVVHAIRLC